MIREKLKSYFDNLQTDPLEGFVTVLTLILSIIGFLQAIEWVLKTSYPLILSISLIIIAIFLILFYLNRPPAYKLYNVKKNISTVIIDQNYLLQINKDGHSKYTKKRTTILLKEPSDEDFRDNVHSSYKESFYKINYISSDSEVSKFIQETDDSVSIYFQPFKRIEKLIPWEHTFSWFPSHIFGGRYDCIRFPVIFPTGKHTTKVETYLPIAKVVCFQEPRWLKVRNYDHLAVYALLIRSTNAPPPSTFSTNGFEWSVVNPKIGSIYNCIFFYPNGEQKLIQKHRILLIWYKLRLSI